MCFEFELVAVTKSSLKFADNKLEVAVGGSLVEIVKICEFWSYTEHSLVFPKQDFTGVSVTVLDGVQNAIILFVEKLKTIEHVLRKKKFDLFNLNWLILHPSLLHSMSIKSRYTRLFTIFPDEIELKCLVAVHYPDDIIVVVDLTFNRLLKIELYRSSYFSQPQDWLLIKSLHHIGSLFNLIKKKYVGRALRISELICCFMAQCVETLNNHLFKILVQRNC